MLQRLAPYMMAALAVPFLQAEAPAKAVTERIDILELHKAGDVRYHLSSKAELTDKPEEVFQMKDGQLHISGRAYGYMATKESYRDYHLIVEFKWTGRTWGKRETRARDSGILVHCHGPDGALSDMWPASIEAQIIEGGMGDILVLSPKRPDGSVIQSRVEAEFERDRDNERRWKKGAPKQEVLSGRINWERRDENWEDKAGYRGKEDLDAPMGEWNKLEVIARGDTLVYLFNDKLVNEASAVSPSFGPIAIQTEAAELVVRRYELLPLSEQK